MKVYLVSDIHVSFPANFEYFEKLLTTSPGDSMYKNASLIICGDVCEDMDLLEKTLKMFTNAFRYVFFVVGNHELWMIRDEKESHKPRTSVDKLNDILALCEKLGVETKAKKIDNAWIVPLLSWHEPHFDDTYDIGVHGDIMSSGLAGDYIYCRWPDHLSPTPQKAPVCGYMLSQNEGSIKEVLENRQPSETIISFSHFVPRIDLINRQCGIDAQIRRVGSTIHAFAHTHIDADREIEGVRYVQRSFGYPRERERWKFNAANYRPFLLGDF